MVFAAHHRFSQEGNGFTVKWIGDSSLQNHFTTWPYDKQIQYVFLVKTEVDKMCSE